MASVGLPAISSKLAPDVRQFLQRVREFVSGANFVSPDDLTRAGIASLDAYGNLTAGSAEETDRSIPPAPVNVTANGALTNIILEWDNPHYKNLSYAEIFRATKSKPEDPDPSIGDAVHIGITSGCIFSDPVPQDSSFWYWVRFWSKAGVVGPWHGTSGIHGATAKDPAYMLATLNGAITTDQLYVGLNERINLIDNPVTGLAATSAGTADGILNALIRVDEMHTDVLREQYISSMTVTMDPVTGKYSVLGTAAVTTDVEARLTSAEFSIDAIEGEIANTVDTVTMQGDRIAAAEGSLTILSNSVSTKASQAFVEAELAVIASGTDPAIVDAMLDSLVQNDSQRNLVRAKSFALATAEQNITANANALGAVAESLTKLSTTVGQHTASIQSTATSINGISASYTMRIDNNGIMSGYGVSSELIAGGAAVSKFINMVDVYAVVAPGRAFGALNSVPFAVLTTAQTINGVYFSPGVYIDGASINRETVGSAQIGKLAVDDSHVAEVSAAKVKFGEMSGDRIEVNTLNSNRLITNTLAAKLAQINEAYVGNQHITGFIQSLDYVAGSSGWKIDKGGAVEFNTGVFRGSLAAASGTFTGEVKGGMFNVGAYTGYAWPAAGSYGAHLGPNGLLLGNANNGTYFQVTANGNLYSPGIKIENGALTIFDPTTGKIIMTSGSVSIAEAAVSAHWSSVYGAGKPADYADVTRNNTAAAIANQGALATVNALTRANISSYMEALAIGTAFIDDLSVNGNKITGVVSGSVYLGAGASVWIPTLSTLGRKPLVGTLQFTNVGGHVASATAPGASVTPADGGFTITNTSVWSGSVMGSDTSYWVTEMVPQIIGYAYI